MQKVSLSPYYMAFLGKRGWWRRDECLEWDFSPLNLLWQHMKTWSFPKCSPHKRDNSERRTTIVQFWASEYQQIWHRIRMQKEGKRGGRSSQITAQGKSSSYPLCSAEESLCLKHGHNLPWLWGRSDRWQVLSTAPNTQSAVLPVHLAYGSYFSCIGGDIK